MRTYFCDLPIGGTGFCCEIPSKASRRASLALTLPLISIVSPVAGFVGYLEIRQVLLEDFDYSSYFFMITCLIFDSIVV